MQQGGHAIEAAREKAGIRLYDSHITETKLKMRVSAPHPYTVHYYPILSYILSLLQDLLGYDRIG